MSKEETAQTIGKKNWGNLEKDAIHIAVAPVVAIERLHAGDHIGFIGGGLTNVGKCDDPIGIVDPFLPEPVQKGETFWMFLYPNTITGLRHDWTHPSFANPGIFKMMTSQPSIDWLTEFAEEVGMSYKELLNATEDWLRTGHYTTLSFDTPDRVYSCRTEFWDHYSNVTGKNYRDRDDTFFSCSC